MDEDAKKEIAVFRFGVINDLVGHRRLKGAESLSRFYMDETTP